MRNYILIALLFIGSLAGYSVSAQEYYSPRTARKGWKSEKKESKIKKKMFRDRPNQASRKNMKARKKEFKRERQEEMHR